MSEEKLNLPTKLANAAGALGRVIKAAATGERILSPEDEVERRLGICRTCEHFTGTTCRLCGCIVNFKTKLETEHCPIGKWGVIKDMKYNVTIEIDAEDVVEIVDKTRASGFKIIAVTPKPTAPPRPPQFMPGAQPPGTPHVALHGITREGSTTPK